MARKKTLAEDLTLLGENPTDNKKDTQALR
jgi:hypothetical protein